MSKPISADLIVCEKALMEADGVISAIRMVDIFYITKLPNIPLEHQAPHLAVLGVIRVPPEDLQEHTIELCLLRPSGASVTIGEPQKVAMPPKAPGSPGGFNFVAQIGVVAKEMGVHYFTLLFDGEEVARYAITLLERQPEVVN